MVGICLSSMVDYFDRKVVNRPAGTQADAGLADTTLDGIIYTLNVSWRQLAIQTTPAVMLRVKV